MAISGWAERGAAATPLRVVGWQASAVAAAAAGTVPLGLAEAGSALLGGLAVVAPNAWFAVGAMRCHAAADACVAARRLLLRGASKWALTALLMAGGLAFAPVKPLGFFAAMIAALAAGALAPLWIGKTS